MPESSRTCLVLCIRPPPSQASPSGLLQLAASVAAVSLPEPFGLLWHEVVVRNRAMLQDDEEEEEEEDGVDQVGWSVGGRRAPATRLWPCGQLPMAHVVALHCTDTPTPTSSIGDPCRPLGCSTARMYDSLIPSSPP